MKLNSEHDSYRRHDVNCSTPQLVLMLHDAAIRHLREAADSLVNRQWEKKGQSVEAARNCISELRRLVNPDGPDQISETLDRMYDLLAAKLLVGNAFKDPEQFNQIVASLRTIRSSWEELFERLRAENKLPDPVQTASLAVHG